MAQSSIQAMLYQILIELVEGRAHKSIKMPLGMEGGLSKKNIEFAEEMGESRSEGQLKS